MNPNILFRFCLSLKEIQNFNDFKPVHENNQLNKNIFNIKIAQIPASGWGRGQCTT